MEMFRCLIFGIVFGAVSGSPGHTTDIVSRLDSNNFDDYISQHNLVLAKFVSPTCDACAELEPEYNEAASILSQRNISVVEIDCKEEKDLCQKQHINIYPTIKSFKDNAQALVYDGPRKTPDIVKYMTKRQLPLVSKITQDSLNDFKSASEPSVVAFWEGDGNSGSHRLKDTFTTVAKDMEKRYFYLFGATNDPSLAIAEDVNMPAIVLYKPYDEKKVLYEGPLDDEYAINLWIRRNALPLVAEVPNEADRYIYFATGLPTVNVFVDQPEQHAHFARELKPIAEQYRNKLNFMTRPIPERNSHARKLGLKDGPWPAVGIEDSYTKYKSVLDQTKEVNSEELSTFIENYLSELEQKQREEDEKINEDMTSPVNGEVNAGSSKARDEL